jgi:uncharacterized delta-60 repeat protein
MRRGVVSVALMCAAVLGGPARAHATSAGTLDPAFGVGGRVAVRDVSQLGSAVVIQPDGRIVVAGGPSTGITLNRYLADGTPDATFGTGGLVTTPFAQTTRATSAVLQADGKIVVAGSSVTPDNFFALVRYLPNGSLDLGFDSDGRVTTDFPGLDDYAFALALEPDGKLVAAGTSTTEFALARYLTDGSLDAGFGTGGLVTTAFPAASAEAHAVVVQPDGTIVAAGFASGQLALARYLANGTLDTTFGTGGRVTTTVGTSAEARALVRQADGKLVVAGRAFDGIESFVLARYDVNGSPDVGFGTGGVVTTSFELPAQANALVADPDGKLVAAGAVLFFPFGFALARYLPDGSLDAGFGAGGRTTTFVGHDGQAAMALARQPDGRLVAAGDYNVVRWLGGTCGNGTVESGEDCDGGPGCDPACCLADADADGRCDAVDPCTGGGAMTKARIKIVGPRSKLTIVGELGLTHPFSPALDPGAGGVRVLLDGPSRNLLDVTIPPGAFVAPPKIGWTTKVTTLGTRWIWVDKTNYPAAHETPAGIFKVKVEDKSNITPGRVKFTLKGLYTYQSLTTELPLSATVVVDAPVAGGGQCGHATFPGPPPAPSCSFRNDGANLTCK